MPRLRNINWEKFCILFVGKCKGNRTLAYAETYGRKINTEKEYRICQVNGSQLLSKPIIEERCRELLDKSGITAEKLDAKLLFYIDQMEDYKVGMSAIKEGNALLKRTGQQANTQVNILNYERILINAGSIASGDGKAPIGNKEQLPVIQGEIPEDTDEKEPAYPI
uniref:Putative terminase n=3 Tax=viral metagenome TaxID=1070528 RepID=A0A6M3J6Z1_9ZZZZ